MNSKYSIPSLFFSFSFFIFYFKRRGNLANGDGIFQLIYQTKMKNQKRKKEKLDFTHIQSNPTRFHVTTHHSFSPDGSAHI